MSGQELESLVAIVTLSTVVLGVLLLMARLLRSALKLVMPAAAAIGVVVWITVLSRSAGLELPEVDRARLQEAVQRFDVEQFRQHLRQQTEQLASEFDQASVTVDSL